MDRFDEFIEHTLGHEGGFVDHPNDPGGATNWGISLRFLRDLEDNIIEYDMDGDGDVDADDMRLLTRDQAIELYRKAFWYDELDQFVAPIHSAKLFDMGVNMGKNQAGKIFQRMVAGFNRDIKVDGIVGPRTVAEANKLIRVGSGAHSFRDLAGEQARFYFDLVDSKRTREVFLVGWLRRAYWLPE